MKIQCLIILLFISSAWAMEKKSISKSESLSWHGFVGFQSEAMKRLWKIGAATKLLTVEQPRIIQLVGPQRCGKSTWAQAYARELGALYKHVDTEEIYSKLVAEGSIDLFNYFSKLIEEGFSFDGKPKILDVDNFESVIWMMENSGSSGNTSNIWETPLLRKIRSACEEHNAIFFAEFVSGSGGGGIGTDLDEELNLSFQLTEGRPTNFEQLIRYYTIQLQEQSSNPPIELAEGLDFEKALKKLHIDYSYLPIHPNAILKKGLQALLRDMALDGKKLLTQKYLDQLVKIYYQEFNNNGD